MWRDREFINFILKHEADKKTLQKIEKINKVLEYFGIELKYSRDDDGGETHFLSISYSLDCIEYKKKRSAGRREAFIDLSVEEIRNRMDKGETAEDIASELNISRSTLFRRLKEANK